MSLIIPPAYVDHVAPDGKLMSVAVKAGETFEPGTETILFQTPLTAGGVGGLYRYDVTADGKRFLVILPNLGDNASPIAADSTPITAVVNWTAALRKK
jgi:hypothetical protein